MDQPGTWRRQVLGNRSGLGHPMDTRTHWETVYRQRGEEEVSWYRPHLEQSLRMIDDAALDRDDPVIDVGAGESTLVDDLLARGYRNVTLLDISEQALAIVRARLGPAATAVEWLAADVTKVTLPSSRYALWHDRAVFHFLVEPGLRERYMDRLRNGLAPGGHVVIATFGPNGPQQCSGLDVRRYDPPSLHEQLGPDFELLDSAIEEHRTPGGKAQEFLYAHFRYAR